MQTNKEKFEELVNSLPKANIKIIFNTVEMKSITLKNKEFWESVASVESFIEEYDPNEKNETAVFILAARSVSRNAGAKFRMVNQSTLMVSEPGKLLYGGYYNPELPQVKYYLKQDSKTEYEDAPAIKRLPRNFFSFIEKTLKKQGVLLR
jgi:hypothetical protein